MTPANLQDELQVQKLLAELTQGPVALSGVIESEVRRARLLPKLRARVSEIPLRKSQRSARKRHTTWAFAAAAVVVTGAGLGRWLNTPPTTAQLLVQPRGNAVEIVENGQHRVLTEAVSIEASGRLETTQSAALTTANGVLLELSAHTRVGLDELNPRSGWRLQLRHGHVACEVPKLTEQKTFSVITDQAEVIVHGTRFTVTSDDTSTCVRVTEGRVEVRSQTNRTFLDPGQAWGCESKEAKKEAAPPVQEEAKRQAPSTQIDATERKHVTGRADVKPTTSVASPGSTLAHETELVGRALSAERRGDRATARGLYAQFLERYPNSPMAPEARRGLKRVSGND